MESLFRDHWEAVLAVLVVLWGLVVALAGLVFKSQTKRLDRHRVRLDVVEDDVSDLKADLADSKRDRKGLHYEIAQGFREVKEQMVLDREANREAHEGIVRLIRNGHK